MARSQRLRVYDIVLLALFRLAFASAPYFLLNLAHYRNSPVHSTKGTPSPINGLWLLVSIWFQVLFHSAPAVLFTFPSRYWFTIGHIGVFSLTGWSRLFPTRFLVPRRTQDSTSCLYISSTGLAPSSVDLSISFDYALTHTLWSYYPELLRFGLFRVRSPLLTESFLFSSPSGT